MYLLQILLLKIDASIASKVLIILNMCIFLVLLVDVSDSQVFLIVYECVLVLLIPALTYSSRSYKRAHALLSFLTLVALCTVCIYVLLTLDLCDDNKTIPCDTRVAILSVLYQVIIVAKIPSYPLTY